MIMMTMMLILHARRHRFLYMTEKPYAREALSCEHCDTQNHALAYKKSPKTSQGVQNVQSMCFFIYFLDQESW